MSSKLNNGVARVSVCEHVDDKNYIAISSKRVTRFAFRQRFGGFSKDTVLKKVSYEKVQVLIFFLLEKYLGYKPINLGKALDAVKYPYKLNKSYLKTPTAEHAFPHIVCFLAWLLNQLQGTGIEEEDEEEEEEEEEEQEPEQEQSGYDEEPDNEILEIQEEPVQQELPAQAYQAELNKIYLRLSGIEELLRKMTGVDLSVKAHNYKTPDSSRSPTNLFYDQQISRRFFDVNKRANSSDIRYSDDSRRQSQHFIHDQSITRTKHYDDRVYDDNIYHREPGVSKQLSSLSLAYDDIQGKQQQQQQIAYKSPEEAYSSPKSPRRSFIALEDSSQN